MQTKHSADVKMAPVFRRLLVVLVMAAFLVSVRTDPASAAGASFHVEGGGFGHGVGMSQYGALGYAQQGAGYKDILAHYYTGTTVSQQSQPGDVRVWLAGDTSAPVQANMSVTGTTNVVLDGVADPVAHADAGQGISVNVESGHFNVVANGNEVQHQIGAAGTNLHIVYGGNPITLDKTGHAYKYGQLELRILTAGSSSACPGPADCLRVILASIDMEHYLLGLGEVPSSWPADALKTPAVAARTYAKEKIDRLGNTRAECDCGVFGDTRDQNYVGYDKETGSGGSNWVSAVNATAGEDVTYNGAAIQAFYASSSGGYTENSEYVFKTALPYLKGVPDDFDSANGQNSLHSWSRDIAFADMQNWVNSSASTSVGTLSNVEFLSQHGVSGRVIQNIADFGGGVRISGSGGTKIVGGDTFRSVINAASGKNTLPSSLMRLGETGPYGGFSGGVFVAAGPLGGGGADRIVTGADSGGGPHVRVLNADKSPAGVEFFAYDQHFTGGVRVAVCHLAGDEGTDEIVTAPGPGGGPHIKIFNSSGGQVGGGFFAYGSSFSGGVYVGCGDVDGNNPGDEIITGAGAGGGPHVKVFDRDGNVLGSFMAYDPGFSGGVRVAAAGAAIVTAPGPGGGPHIKLLNTAGDAIGQWMAYAPNFSGGVYVAGGNIMGDGAAEVVTGAGEVGAAHVRVFSAAATVLSEFYAFNTGNDHGARVATAHVPDGAVVAGSGKGSPSLVHVIEP